MKKTIYLSQINLRVNRDIKLIYLERITWMKALCFYAAISPSRSLVTVAAAFFQLLAIQIIQTVTVNFKFSFALLL